METNIEEIWKDVVGYEGLYEVSSVGRVKNHKTGLILKQQSNKRGYSIISLLVGPKRRSHLAHRLVAKAFIPNLENKPTVNHIDFNKSNNQIDNLEWCTILENNDHYLSTPKEIQLEILRNPTKLNEEKVRIIKCLIYSKERKIRLREIGDKFKVTQQMIGMIKNGKCWADVSV